MLCSKVHYFIDLCFATKSLKKHCYPLKNALLFSLPINTMLKLKRNYRCMVQRCGWVGGRVQATVIAFAYGCFFAYDKAPQVYVEVLG